jgi:uncharacterized protein
MKSISIFLILFTFSSAWSQTGTSGQKIGNPPQLSAATASSPEDPLAARMVFIGKVYMDSIVLRWTPGKAIAWKFANQYGYVVERIEVQKDNVKPDFQKLTGNPIKPLGKEEWITRFGPDNKYAAVAGQGLFGTSAPAMPNPDIETLKNMATVQDIQYTFALLAADFNAPVAAALGLRLADKAIKPGTQYVYRVYTQIPREIFKTDTAYLFLSTSQIEETPVPPKPNGVSMNNAISIDWETRLMNSYFTAYLLERSDDGGKNYHSVSKSPILLVTTEELKDETKIFHRDTLLVNYKTYLYRLRGLTPFGETSEPSEVLEIMPKDRVAPPAPEITGINDVGNGCLQINWRKTDPVPDFLGFKVFRSPKLDGPFDSLHLNYLPTGTTDFVDKNPDPMGGNFYIVTASDTAGNIASSLISYGFLSDSVPPSKPTGLTGICDTNGIVTLRWNLGPEPDIIGYRVYYSNDPSHEFANHTGYPLKDTVFLDTIQIKTLTRKIYYKIFAVDRNYNHSEPSEILTVRRPDVVPPITPVFNDYKVNETEVYLSWIPSPSEDLMKTLLYMRKSGTQQWIELLEWPADNTLARYTVDSLEKKQFYEFSLVAVDSSALRSPFSFPVKVRTYDIGLRTGISDLNGIYSSSSKQVKLTWNYSEQGKFYYVVYRSYNNSDLLPYKNVEPGGNAFNDNDSQRNGRYRYAVKVIYTDGGESPVSVPVDIIVE